MDRSADPSRDFYDYACGHWIQSNPVPADKSRWSSFDELLERNFVLVREILDKAARSSRTATPSARRMVGDFYTSALDRRTRERVGFRPIAADLRQIGRITSLRALVQLAARSHDRGVPGLFDPGVAPDEKDSSVYTFYLSQGGLSLPDREYYLRKRFAEVRGAYRTHVARIFGLLGEKPKRAEGAADAVLAIETGLARASRSRTALRDPRKNYHRFTPERLAERYPQLRWRLYLRLRGLGAPPFVIVGQPEFFDGLDRLLGTTPLSDWRAYLRWHLAHRYAPFLHDAAESEDFDFFHRRLLGQAQPEPEWKRAAIAVDRAIGEALGKLYVKRHFPPRSRIRMAGLVEDLKAVFRERLAEVPWLTEETRERALAKFARFTTKIGHPERFRDYSALTVSRDDYVGNLRRASAFEVRRNLIRVGGPVDRSEWHMTPPTVNAYFHPNLNEIVFPAGILQPPFFDPELDDAVNLGGIGVVIGHEITHGYDDQGRKYDADGNLKDWWVGADARAFEGRAKRIVRQYSEFEPLPGIPVNGHLTMGENIADLGGVRIAFEALRRRLADGRSSRRKIEGFTPEQRFFLAFGQVWRGNVREAELRRRLTIDPHSPGRYRVLGPLANVPEFWDAFGVRPGAPMRRPEPDRVEIW